MNNNIGAFDHPTNYHQKPSAPTRFHIYLELPGPPPPPPFFSTYVATMDFRRTWSRSIMRKQFLRVWHFGDRYMYIHISYPTRGGVRGVGVGVGGKNALEKKEGLKFQRVFEPSFERSWRRLFIPQVRNPNDCGRKNKQTDLIKMPSVSLLINWGRHISMYDSVQKRKKKFFFFFFFNTLIY